MPIVFFNSCRILLGFIILNIFIDFTAQAVPTSFLLSDSGTQSDVTWQLLESSHFRLYVDTKAQAAAEYGIKSLEYAWPYYSNLLGVKFKQDVVGGINDDYIISKFDKIPVILGTRAETGGFANPITQNIEIQVLSPTGASLFQHELVHRTMYEHFDLHIGAGGRTFSLAMIPTWWIEGLAEYFTESIGYLESEGIIRTLTQRNAWASWDSLHSLYGSNGDYGIGYATAGKFVKYLIENLPRKQSIASINDAFFKKTITPPFVDATWSFLNSNWHKNGSDLYDDFKKAQEVFWKKYIDKIPLLDVDMGKKAIMHANQTPAVVTTKDHIFTSDLSRDKTRSAIVATNRKTGKMERLPVALEGSNIWGVNINNNSASIWTTKNIGFNNESFADNIVIAQYSGELSAINDKNISNIREIKIGNKEYPREVYQIIPTQINEAFVLSNLRGEQVLLYVNSDTGNIKQIYKWNAPINVRLLTTPNINNSDKCVVGVIDYDLEVTSLEKFCLKGASVLIPPKKIRIFNAVERTDGSFLLLLGWNKLLGIAEFDGTKLGKSFAFPEWATKLVAFPGELDQFGLWIFNGNGLYLQKFSFATAEKKFRSEIQTKDNAQEWQLPSWQEYIPPFVALSNNKVENKTVEEPKVSLAPDAPYLHHHLFSYPSIIPPYFGGWSLGLVSVPYMDEMERDRVDIYAQYSIGRQQPTVQINYSNNRIMNGASLSLYSGDKFNGMYYWNVDKKTNKGKMGYYLLDSSKYLYYNYLRENAVNATVVKKFSPSSVIMSVGAKAAHLQPDGSQYYSVAIPVLGVQQDVLASLQSSLSLSLFDWIFRLGNPAQVGASYLSWHTSLLFSGEASHSIGRFSQNIVGERTEPLNFQKFDAGYASSISLFSQTITLRQNISGTVGRNSLLLKELFQPYRTYLLGSGSALNHLNYSIIGDGKLFSLDTGIYSYRSTLDYSFPIWSKIDKQFLILYLDNINGEFVLSHGGVARQKNFADRISKFSASIAARATIDIKGFKIFPSLAYGQIIGSKGWALFSELSFSEFF